MHRVGHPVTWRLLVYKEFETYQTYVPLHDRYGAYGRYTWEGGGGGVVDELEHRGFIEHD